MTDDEFERAYESFKSEMKKRVSKRLESTFYVDDIISIRGNTRRANEKCGRVKTVRKCEIVYTVEGQSKDCTFKFENMKAFDRIQRIGRADGARKRPFREISVESEMMMSSSHDPASSLVSRSSAASHRYSVSNRELSAPSCEMRYDEDEEGDSGFCYIVSDIELETAEKLVEWIEAYHAKDCDGNKAIRKPELLEDGAVCFRSSLHLKMVTNRIMSCEEMKDSNPVVKSV